MLEEHKRRELYKQELEAQRKKEELLRRKEIQDKN